MFAVDDIDETLERLRKRGAQLVGELSSIKTRIGSATFAGMKGFSLDSPKNSAERSIRTLSNEDCSAVYP